MKRRRSVRPPSRGRQAPPPPGRRRPRRITPWVLPGLAVMGVVAILAHPWRPARPVDPLARLDPRTAFDRGLELARRERTAESLPYLARAAADHGASWREHFTLGATLYNLTLEKQRLHGVQVPWPRTNRRSIALIHQALDAFDRAESLATTPAERARVWSARGMILAWWGMPLDALVSLRRAYALDPRPQYGGVGDVVLRHVLSDGADSTGLDSTLAPSPL